MNILHVNMSIDPVTGGGTVERTCQLTRELQKLPNTEAKVLSTTVGLDEDRRLNDSQFILLPCVNERWYIPMPYFRKIYNVLKWSDIVVISNHWAVINAMVYLVNLVVKRPYMFCPAGSLHIFGRSSLMKQLYNKVIGKRILEDATIVIAIPKDERAYIRSLGIPAERIKCIPNGISCEDFVYSDHAGFRAKYSIGVGPILLFMGRLNEIKGPDLLLSAFCNIAKEYPEWHLIFAGPDGGMEEKIRNEILKQGLQNRIHLIGFVSGKDKSSAYHAAEVLVVPSRKEAMSIVALEAGICGTAVIMTDECGFSEMVDAGAAIEVPADIVSLTKALSNSLSDRDKLKTMGSLAKKFINENYTWEMAAKEYRELCNKVLNL